jgi:hypothetical protein
MSRKANAFHILDERSLWIFLPPPPEVFPFSESFEGTGYENTWVEDVGNGSIDPDSTTVSPPSGGGSQVLEFVQASADYDAAVYLDTGNDREISYTDLYYRNAAEDLGNGEETTLAQISSSTDFSTARWRITLYQTAAKLYFRVYVYTSGSLSLVDTSDQINQDTWYKISIKYDRTGTAWEWWLDNVSQASGSLSASLGDAPRYWWLGSNSDDYAMTNYFDLIDVYAETLGQPTQTRTWGIPTGSGSRDRPGGWN